MSLENSYYPGQKINRPSRLMALEPRFLYDGAGAEVIADTAGDLLPQESAAAAADAAAQDAAGEETAPETAPQEETEQDTPAAETSAATVEQDDAGPEDSTGEQGDEPEAAAAGQEEDTEQDAAGSSTETAADLDAETGTDSGTDMAADPDTETGAEYSTVVFVDSSVEDYETLVSAITADADDAATSDRDTVLIKPLDSTDPVVQIRSTLNGCQDLDAIHIISHGDVGTLQLGSTAINNANLDQYQDDIAAWGEALGEEGDILLYGCRVAQDGEGHEFINNLAEITGADIAASDDATGNASSGGDWNLEAATGIIEAAELLNEQNAAGWDGLLAEPTVEPTTETITVLEPSELNANPATDSQQGLGLIQLNYSGTSDITVELYLPAADTSSGQVTGTGVQAETLSRQVKDAGVQSVTVYHVTGTLSEVNDWLTNNLAFEAADVELGDTAVSSKLQIRAYEGGFDDTNHGEQGHNPAMPDQVTVNITPVNDPAKAVQATLAQTLAEGATHTIDFEATDPEVSSGTQTTDQLVYTLQNSPTHGYLSLDGTRLGENSVFTQQDIDDGRVQYHHTEQGAQQNDNDQFTLLLNDGATPESEGEVVIVPLTITPVNQAPTVSGSATVYEGQPANAQNAEAIGMAIEASTGGDPQDSEASLTVSITSLPTDGVLYFDGTAITQQMIDNGYSFAYTDRDKLTYANNGQRDNNNVGTYPFTDGFDVTVTDSGGGEAGATNTTASTTIDISVLPVNDDPVFPGADPTGTVDAANYQLPITTAHLPITDVDSPDSNLSFVVSDESGLNQGVLAIQDGNGDWLQLPEGGTFTLDDVNNGKVCYFQTADIPPGAADQQDSFTFQVFDQTTEPRWNPDGTQITRPGAVYDDNGTPEDYSDDTVKDIVFTIDLQEVQNNPNGSIIWDVWQPGSGSEGSSHAGSGYTTSGSADPVGTLDEGGSITIEGTNHALGAPYMSYTVSDGTTTLSPSQVVYTITDLGEGDNGGWNGTIRKNGSALGLYDTFTQQDLNDNLIEFEHDGGEDFYSTASFDVSAGLMVNTGTAGNPVYEQDNWQTTFEFYITPINDAPTISGSDDTVIPEQEGYELFLTTDHITVGDPDDANSAPQIYHDDNGNPVNVSVEDSPTSPADPNYAYNNQDGELTLVFTELPTDSEGGRLYYYDGTDWQEVVADTTEIPVSALGDNTLKFVASGVEDVNEVTLKVKSRDRHDQDSANEAEVIIQITPVNDAPMIASDPTETDPGYLNASGDTISSTNDPLTVLEGSTTQIGTDKLKMVDPDNTDAQIQYRITDAPEHGTVAISQDGGSTYKTLGVGASFSQADVNNGKIFFIHNGDESDGTTYSSGQDDKFTFDISDGNKFQTGNEFWIYVNPLNDPPEITGPAEHVELTQLGTATNVSGFSVSDPDLDDGVTTGETDYVQATVRLLDADGNPLPQASYTGITLSAGGQSENGVVTLSGSRADVNSALAGLQVTIDAASGTEDVKYSVQVIVDDRTRSGGTIEENANGGDHNQPEDPGGNAGTISTTPINFYSDSTNDILTDFKGNVAAAEVELWVSPNNEQAGITAPGPLTVQEDVPAPVTGITITDAESAAFGTALTTTLTVDSGTLEVGSQSGVTVTGNNTGTITLEGDVVSINALLAGLTYTTASNVNHDMNGASTDGDVSLTITVNEGESAIGAGGTVEVSETVPITITPINDGPTITNTGASIAVSSGTPVSIPGFTLGDIDIQPTNGDGDQLADGEDNYISALIRLTNEDGTPFNSAEYGAAGKNVQIATTGGSAAAVHSTYNGANAACYITGTYEQVNDFLADLSVGIGEGNPDNTYKVEVIVDDRLRDGGTGNIISEANGGQLNQNGTGTPTAVPTGDFRTDTHIYGSTAASIDNLAPVNIDVATREIFISDINDPAAITAENVSVAEGAGTITLDAGNANFTVADPDDHGAEMTATVTINGGSTTGLAITQAGDNAGVTGLNSSTITITGTEAAINARLQALTIAYPDPAGDAAAADWNGRFTVTVALDDGGNTGGDPGTGVDGQDPGDLSQPGDATQDAGIVSHSGGNDPSALTTTRTIEVEITPVNDAPVVTAGQEVSLPAVAEDTADPSGQTVNTLFNALVTSSEYGDDADNIAESLPGTGHSPDAFIGIAIVHNAANATTEGTWQYDTGSGWTNLPAVTNSNALYLDQDASLRFVPAANYNGDPGTLTVHLVEDDINDDSASIDPATSGQTVDVSASGGTTIYTDNTVAIGTSITPVNDPPVATNDSYTTAEDTPVVIAPLTSGTADSDPDNDTLTITSINVNTVTGGAQTIPVPNGTVNIDNGGTITFTPDTDFHGISSFEYEISDGNGGTDTATETITVTSVNDPPLATDDNYTTAINTPVDLTPLDGDSDPDNDHLTITSINGTAVTGGVQTIVVPNGTVNIDAGGSITFTPDTDYQGTTSFDYTISDGNGGTDTATETIAVNNQDPTAVNDNYTTLVDTPVTLDPLAGDSDPDGHTLYITSINGEPVLPGNAQTITVPNGTVNIDAGGTITFTPDPGYTGTSSFEYEISDAHGGTDTATETITITSPSSGNEPPEAIDDNYTTGENTPVTLNPLAGDSDPDGDPLSITTINGVAVTGGAQTIPVANGTVTIAAGGAITFTPDPGYTGTTSFTYTISDGNGGTDTAIETITVEAAPVADEPGKTPAGRAKGRTSLEPDQPAASPSSPVLPEVPVESSADPIPVALTADRDNTLEQESEPDEISTTRMPQQLHNTASLGINGNTDLLLGTEIRQYIHDTVNHAWYLVERWYGAGDAYSEFIRYDVVGGAQDDFNGEVLPHSEVLGDLNVYLDTIFTDNQTESAYSALGATSVGLNAQLENADRLSREIKRLLKEI